MEQVTLSEQKLKLVRKIVSDYGSVRAFAEKHAEKDFYCSPSSLIQYLTLGEKTSNSLPTLNKVFEMFKMPTLERVTEVQRINKYFIKK